MEVNLDSPPAEVDQKATHQHLADRHGVPGRRLAWPDQGQGDGQADDRPTQDDRGPNVDMEGKRLASPGIGRNPQGERDAHQPLQHQQDRK